MAKYTKTLERNRRGVLVYATRKSYDGARIALFATYGALSIAGIVAIFGTLADAFRNIAGAFAGGLAAMDGAQYMALFMAGIFSACAIIAIKELKQEL